MGFYPDGLARLPDIDEMHPVFNAASRTSWVLKAMTMYGFSLIF
jgi:hypothetical protein